MTLAEDARQFSRAAREAAEGSGWRVRDGTLSRIDGEVTFHASIFADAMNFHAKPVVWDVIFWKVLDFEMKRRPQATRHWTRFSCNVPIRAQARVRPGPPKALAKQLLDFADTAMRRPQRWDELPRERFFPDRDEDFQTARVLDLLSRGETDAARRKAADVVSGRLRSMYSHSTQAGSFFDLAVAKIDAGFFERSG